MYDNIISELLKITRFRDGGLVRFCALVELQVVKRALLPCLNGVLCNQDMMFAFKVSGLCAIHFLGSAIVIISRFVSCRFPMTNGNLHVFLLLTRI